VYGEWNIFPPVNRSWLCSKIRLTDRRKQRTRNHFSSTAIGNDDVVINRFTLLFVVIVSEVTHRERERERNIYSFCQRQWKRVGLAITVLIRKRDSYCFQSSTRRVDELVSLLLPLTLTFAFSLSTYGRAPYERRRFRPPLSTRYNLRGIYVKGNNGDQLQLIERDRRRRHSRALFAEVGRAWDVRSKVSLRRTDFIQ